jgi:Tfp pilus assembly protein PilF
MNDSSPLVRSAAADSLQHVPTREALQALVKATMDDYRLVRVRAASSLAANPNFQPDEVEKKSINKANAEYLASLTSRSDQWSSYYNLGNYYMNRSEPRTSITYYETALKLEPRAVLAMVNESIAYARLGETKKSETSLQKALKIAPENAAANFNMGLLKAEQNDLKGAEKYLKAALKYDTQMAQAAYNLCIITTKDRINEGIGYCKKAADLRPQEPRYSYTLAFYQQQTGDSVGAAKTLESLIEKQPAYADAHLLLGTIYQKQGKKYEAEKVYSKALENEGIPEVYKARISAELNRLRQ